MILPTELADDELPASAVSGAIDIARQLREAIEAGAYVDGQRLPAERLLARHFGTSRSTIRESLRLLEETDLVDRRPGSGTFVRFDVRSGDHELAEAVSPMELIEVREAMEPHIARLAIAHASARTLEACERAMQALEQAGADRERFATADEGFHLAIADATANPLLIALYGQLNRVRAHRQWAEMKRKILTPANIALYNEQHRYILRAIARRDADEAAAAVRRHLAKARADLVGIGQL